MKKIKVLQSISSLNIGGAERLVVRIFEELDDRKYEKHLIIFKKGDYEISIKDLNVKIYYIDRDPLKSSFSVFMSIYRIIKQNKIDIVHTHLYLANFFVRSAAYCAGCRNIIFHEHGGYLKRSIRHRFVNYLFQIITDKYIYISKHDRQHFAYLDRIKKRTSLYTIPNPLLIKEAEKNKHKKRDFTIGMIGQLIELKGHKYGLEAFHILKDEGYHFNYILIGDGPEKENLLKLINKWNIEVFLPGIVQDIEEYLINIDILIHPSISEGFGLVILEAMYFGIPVIATAIGGITDIIIDGFNGILLKSGNPKEIVDGIKKIYHNEEIYNQYSKTAKEYVKEKYSIERYMQKITSLYCD